ncbi:sigma 54-interacting transcriptional regulator [soil metagenome]
MTTKYRYTLSMERDLLFSSINNLIARKNPLSDTLRTIVTQLAGRDGIGLARIWLIGRGDICSKCPMRAECPDQERCLHLTASEGGDLQGKQKWNSTSGRFSRIPIGVRKVGSVAQAGNSVLIDELHIGTSDWIVDKEWVKQEGIVGFAAHPLRFQDDVLGVLAVFSRETINPKSFEWLRAYADQASVAIANARAFEELERLRQALEDENEYLREEVTETSGHKFLIGKSPVWQKVLQQIDMVGTSDATVLITGESGTGKELVARAIHEASNRSSKPLIKVNCAAISSELFESEFFGHAKGAFTGAVRDRAGRFQVADGGTIFLDEIGEVPLALQGKLLRVLQEKQFERVGEDRTRTVDVRVVTATNRNLADEVQKGNFREDLYYRLSVFPIGLPPLRDRTEDVEALASHFLKQFSPKSSGKELSLSTADLAILKSYSYPGNVRELQNIIERAVIVGRCDRLNFTLPEIFSRIVPTGNDDASKVEVAEAVVKGYSELKDLERQFVTETLKKTNYKIYGDAGAAAILDIKPTTLISRIKAMNIPMRPG